MNSLGAALVALTLSSAPAGEYWSFSVHRIVCEIAWQRLSEPGKQLVRQIRAEEESPSSTFAESCVWADRARGGGHQSTYQYHFINVDRGSADVDWRRDCGAYDCVTVAVIRYAQYLTIPGSSERSRRQRAEALKFLGHFVGDIHQPLHVAYDEDLGGNTIDVIWNGEERLLHSVWDTRIPAAAGLATISDAQRIALDLSDADAAHWETFDVFGWTDETYDLAVAYAYPFPSGDLAGSDYAARGGRVAREQIAKAGVRLAFLINHAATGTLDFPPFPDP